MPWRADPHPSGPGRPGEPDPRCERARDRIDPYLEEDLPGAEARELEAHLEGCPDCRTELALARRLRAALRDGLPLLTCPPEVSAEVLRVARAEEESANALDDPSAPRFAERLRSLFGGGLLRPALAVAAALVLLVAAPLLYRSVTGPEPETETVAVTDPGPAYSAQEVARAEEEARLILAYVASVGRDAERAVREEVFADGIGRPTRRVMESLGTAGLGVAPEEAADDEGRVP